MFKRAVRVEGLVIGNITSTKSRELQAYIIDKLKCDSIQQEDIPQVQNSKTYTHTAFNINFIQPLWPNMRKKAVLCKIDRCYFFCTVLCILMEVLNVFS